MIKKLEIKIIKAEFKKDQEISKMDPYAILKIKNQTYKTKVKKKAGKFPVWNESTVMYIDPEEDNGLITVWDKDTFTKDDFLGECNIMFNEIFEGYDSKFEYNLYSKKNEVVGKIFIEYIHIN